MAAALAQNKRASSPTEVLKVAVTAKKTSAKKAKKAIKVSSSDDTEEEDQLKSYKEKITKTIQKEIFPTMKFVKGPGTLTKLCSHILYYGDFGKLKKHERAAWKDQFGAYCIAELNSLRSNLYTAIKDLFKAKYYKSTPPDMGSILRWEACLTRDLDMNQDQDKEDYEFWYGTLMDKATANQDRWNIAHRGYMTIYSAKPPKHARVVEPACDEDKDRHYYVTPETEAYTMLVIRGNLEKWEAQYLTKTWYPGYKQKIYHKAVPADKILASNLIKQEIYISRHPDITTLEALPNGWLASMRMPWEDDDNFVSICAICPFFIMYLALF